MFSADQLKDRIRKAAKDLGIEDVNRVRTIVTLERIVARLVTNKYLKDHLVFGGGFVLFKELETSRYTKDADAIIKGTNPESLKGEIYGALAVDLDDGFWFGDIETEELEAESGYGGFRFSILYKVGGPFPSQEEKIKLRRIHLDISIGVDLEDVAKETRSDSILQSLNAIEWKVYPPEFIASEKIHCLLYRGSENSRGKDVFDLPLIFNEVSDNDLFSAIERTFSRREFEIVSMYETAKSISTENLKKSYNLVSAKNLENTFEESWNQILQKLKNLDILRNKVK